MTLTERIELRRAEMQAANRIKHAQYQRAVMRWQVKAAWACVGLLAVIFAVAAVAWLVVK